MFLYYHFFILARGAPETPQKQTKILSITITKPPFFSCKICLFFCVKVKKLSLSGDIDLLAAYYLRDAMPPSFLNNAIGRVETLEFVFF